MCVGVQGQRLCLAGELCERKCSVLAFPILWPRNWAGPNKTSRVLQQPELTEQPEQLSQKFRRHLSRLEIEQLSNFLWIVIVICSDHQRNSFVGLIEISSFPVSVGSVEDFVSRNGNLLSGCLGRLIYIYLLLVSISFWICSCLYFFIMNVEGSVSRFVSIDETLCSQD